MADEKVYIDVIIDDKGTTKKVAVDSKEFGTGLDKASKSSGTFNRNMKGLLISLRTRQKTFQRCNREWADL